MQYPNATKIVVDWCTIKSEGDFYDIVLSQCDAPKWHGRNLNALFDSWVTGDINGKGPPYAFAFFALGSTPSILHGFRDSVVGIAHESIRQNGGSFIQGTEN